MDPKYFTVVAGQETRDRWDAELKAQVDQGEDLVRVQEKQSSQGRIGVEIVKSLRGYSVRYDSGLQGFDLLASSRSGGGLDGSLDDAIRYATQWVANDPTNRYAWLRK